MQVKLMFWESGKEICDLTPCLCEAKEGALKEVSNSECDYKEKGGDCFSKSLTVIQQVMLTVQSHEICSSVNDHATLR